MHAAHSAPTAPLATAAMLDRALQLQTLLHSTASADVVWPLLALALSGFCLLLCRRLIATH